MDPYKHRSSSAYNSPFFTINSGASVRNNNSSLIVGSRGKESQNVFMLEVLVQKGSLKCFILYLRSLVLISLEPLEARPL
uniref:Uncharacterized protein n=1 Tax=Populus trichocarpa TaxID=3694 RepID=A0A3N7G1H9_POPTR